MQTALTKKIAPARMLLLTEEECAAYHTYLQSDDMPFDLKDSVIAGSIGIEEELLQKAVRIAEVFRRACRSLHASFQKHSDTLLKPFQDLPSVRSSLLASPFCLTYFRMDFFLDQHDERAPLKIMEVNSGGAGLTDMLRCIRHLRRIHTFDPPQGYQSIEIPNMLQALLLHGKTVAPFKTLGLVGVENGSDDSLLEYIEYAKWLKANTDVEPVLLSLTEGELALLPNAQYKNPIKDLQELDAIFFDWFENLPALEKVTKKLMELNIQTIPARSDLLFEQKRFLPLLRNCEKPVAISQSDWDLLLGAILPSFPLEEFVEHLEEMKRWPGIVLKMDLDCASENVFIYDFEKTTYQEAVASLTFTQANGHPTKILDSNALKPSWVVQRFVPPPHIPLATPTPAWVGYDYAPYKFDLMTYLCYEEEIPRVLFGTRCFSREKYDELTEEGLEDILWGPVSIIDK
ncbi:MAG TPA: hypothetical protein VJB60_01565 [Candidatus Peribacterales bacterium]|nr:hypothetical protein [Candidatus Peribacterales bacterium]